jgi:hypothetical protein
MSEENPIYDPAKGRAALGRLEGELAKLRKEDLALVTLDLQEVALAVLGVTELTHDPEVRRMFELLPAPVFDIRHLDLLPDLGWAAWHSRIEFLTASSSATKARLPVDLVERSTTRKNRMLKVVEYHLGDDPTEAAEVAAIRAGTGYLDTATDLVRLAGLYLKHAPRLALDVVSYRASDEDDARADSAEIMRHLNAEGGAASRWAEMQSRVWTKLFESYEEVRAAGQFLFRHDARKDRFPSLFAAARRPRRPVSAPPGSTTPSA